MQGHAEFLYKENHFLVHCISREQKLDFTALKIIELLMLQ